MSVTVLFDWNKSVLPNSNASASTSMPKAAVFTITSCSFQNFLKQLFRTIEGLNVLKGPNLNIIPCKISIQSPKYDDIVYLSMTDDKQQLRVSSLDADDSIGIFRCDLRLEWDQNGLEKHFIPSREHANVVTEFKRWCHLYF